MWSAPLDILENGHIPAAWVSAILAFLIYWTAYPIYVPVTYPRKQLNCLVTILTLTIDIPYMKTSPSNVIGFVIVRKMIALFVVDFSIY